MPATSRERTQKDSNTWHTRKTPHGPWPIAERTQLALDLAQPRGTKTLTIDDKSSLIYGLTVECHY
ncbi:uncharacterized protein BT62DRAFT_936517 [Guyanagaster necrorhizus]|uniref:Uncharacterized protein n=1 Tax=Guyanagaster necrorhizus TaxID=856835 RepID=A0A9P7VL39_9AGAR|nr:uncharacterized protein BT62DRAFT_936517 [Guyanagaster necrorhizus MCA 3950]KAG7441899.1 hypothetical protein BT62DRAFT_936517 [Guyanagaster necrorhizus MCA 3950]